MVINVAICVYRPAALVFPAATLKVTTTAEPFAVPAFDATVLAVVVTDLSSTNARSVPDKPIPYSFAPVVTAPSDTSPMKLPPALLKCPSPTTVVIYPLVAFSVVVMVVVPVAVAADVIVPKAMLFGETLKVIDGGEIFKVQG